MSDDKRLDTLSEEIKLLKGEIKNSLTSVRDYLLNMELPSSEFSTILAALSGDNGGGQKITLTNTPPPPQNNVEDTLQDEGNEINDNMTQPPPDEDLLDMEQPEMLDEPAAANPLIGEEDDLFEPEDMLPQEDMPEEITEKDDQDTYMEEEEIQEEPVEEPVDEPEDVVEQPEEEIVDETAEAEPDIETSGQETETPAEEEHNMELEWNTPEMNQGIPKVNMLANLINWVAKAKQEIGDEMLPTFLDVYGVSGHLSLELKEVILHLAAQTQEKTESCTDAEVWSQSMLSLHGILTGGDAPLNPPIPSIETAFDLQSQEEEIIEVDKQPERPVKLKFVFPNGNGKEKEYCLDLTPEDNGNEEE